MTFLLKELVMLIAYFHEKLIDWNVLNGYDLTDKQLHFLVIGVLGLAMIFVINPIFTLLAKKNHVMVISWIYVVTVLIVITFAIEIGQKWSGTGVMEFKDIAFGMLGFFAFFLLFALIRELIKQLIRIVSIRSNDDYEKDEDYEYYEEDED